MISHLGSIAISLFVAANCWAAELIPSWNAVVVQLLPKENVLEMPIEKQWTNSPIVRNLVLKKDSGALLELAAQSKDGFTEIATFFALRTFDRKAALELGLEMVMSQSATKNSLLLSVIEAVGNDLQNEVGIEALGRAFARKTYPLDNVRLVTRLLPEPVLRKWFENDSRPACILSFEAIVLSRLYQESAERQEAPSNRMLKTKERYFFIPGIPRTVYVYLSDPKDPNFKEAVRLCLQDEGLSNDDVISLVQTLAYFGHLNIDLAGLRLSNDRLELIKKELNKKNVLQIPRK